VRTGLRYVLRSKRLHKNLLKGRLGRNNETEDGEVDDEREKHIDISDDRPVETHIIEQSRLANEPI
jgi:hypothetical protein